MPLAEISRRLDVPIWTLRDWVADLNPGTGNTRRYDREQIAWELSVGIPRADICERHGCSVRWLSDFANGKLPP